LRRQNLDEFEQHSDSFEDDYFGDSHDNLKTYSPARATAAFEDYESTALGAAILNELATQTAPLLLIDVPALADSAGCEPSDIRSAVRLLVKTGALANLKRRCSASYSAKRGAAFSG
jgi:hypothetical protein